MRTSCAMMASSVTLSAEDEGAEVDGVVEVRGVAVFVQCRLGLSYALLYLMVVTSMAYITEK